MADNQPVTEAMGGASFERAEAERRAHELGVPFVELEDAMLDRDLLRELLGAEQLRELLGEAELRELIDGVSGDGYAGRGPPDESVSTHAPLLSRPCRWPPWPGYGLKPPVHPAPGG